MRGRERGGRRKKREGGDGWRSEEGGRGVWERVTYIEREDEDMQKRNNIHKYMYMYTWEIPIFQMCMSYGPIL